MGFERETRSFRYSTPIGKDLPNQSRYIPREIDFVKAQACREFISIPRSPSAWSPFCDDIIVDEVTRRVTSMVIVECEITVSTKRHICCQVSGNDWRKKTWEIGVCVCGGNIGAIAVHETKD